MAEQADCVCLMLDYVKWDYDEKPLGTDRNWADVTLRTCRRCGRLWLHYHYENEAFSKSGRWYRGVVSAKAAKSIEAEDALDLLAKLDWYIYGGSYFGGVGKSSGPIFL
ncbi:MAG: hypothetical protein HYS33_10415 [Acidobacteria bacterium]|nr:hypothetical protein [Acidobacteriota bacterium]